MAMCSFSVANTAVIAPSFIAIDRNIHELTQVTDAVFAQFANFNDDALDSIADAIINFLEDNGFQANNPHHVDHLASFVQDMTTTKTPLRKKASKFMDELKKMALKTWHATKHVAKGTAKDIILAGLKVYLRDAIKEVLPLLEQMNERAFRTLPVNLRVALAPVAYNLWSKFFERTKARLPPGFKIENFVCKALEVEKCDEVIERVKNTWSAPATEEAVEATPTKAEQDLAAEIDDFDLSDAI